MLSTPEKNSGKYWIAQPACCNSSSSTPCSLFQSCRIGGPLARTHYAALLPRHVPVYQQGTAFTTLTQKPSARVRFTRLALILAALALLPGVCAGQLPDPLTTDAAVQLPIASFLQRADQAMRNNDWQSARDCFEQAFELADETRRDEIRQHLQWCYAREAVKNRYTHQSVTRHVHSINGDQAQALLAETLQLVKRHYHKRLDVDQLLAKSLAQLQAATKDAHFCRQFGVTQANLADLSKHIQSLQKKTGPCELDQLLAAARLLRNSSKKAGLEESWPALELAYAFVDSLDNYSYLLSPDQYQSLRNLLRGYYVGVGINLAFADSYPTVRDVIRQSPAHDAGIAPGDILLEIAGLTCRDKSPAQVNSLLTGPSGSQVLVTIKRGDHQWQMLLKRRLIAAPSVRQVKLLGSDKRVGYMRVACFDHDTAMEICRAIEQLKARGAAAFLLDLRGNGGGVMTAAVDAVRLFVSRGEIVTVKSLRQTTKYCAGGDSFRCYRQEMALLVDENTASAAEVFAAALQDHHRATVIGRKTFGKTAMQTLYGLNHGHAGLCITTAAYFRAGRKRPAHQGVIPDVLVEKKQMSTRKDLSPVSDFTPQDPTLQQGLNHLQCKISS